MKKRWMGVLSVLAMGACLLTGCQQAPEVTESGGIPHAKSNVEQAVEDVAARGEEDAAAEGAARGEEGAAAGGAVPGESGTAVGGAAGALAEQGGFYDQLIGTQENGIWVYAEVPAVAEKINRLTLTARDDLDVDTMKAFLGSQNGKVQDITQQYLAEREAELNAPPVVVDAGDGLEESYTEIMTHFGDESTFVFFDGERRATFTWNTSAFFQDEKLRERYFETVSQSQEAKELDGGGGNEGAAFPMAQAEGLLMEKLGTLGITEIDYKRIYYWEHDGEGCYEMHFTPRFEGISLAREFGSNTREEIIPGASALLTKDGVAEVNLWNALGKVGERKDMGKVLSFSQVEDILKKYLEGNLLTGCPAAKLTEAELVYYPLYQEETSELELIPAWHIYVPLDQALDGLEAGDPAYAKLMEGDGARNIYLDAVTGELLKVE